MGKTQAEIQKAYRERKKLKEGSKYLEKESQRVKAYYVPTANLKRKDAKERREKTRQYVNKYRQKKKTQVENSQTCEPVASSNKLQDSNVSSSTEISGTTGPLIVKLPAFDQKKRTRTRISKATAKSRREIRKLEEDKTTLNRKYKRIAKRYERLVKKTKDAQKDRNINNETVQDNQDGRPNLTPRKRSLDELMSEGISPSKIPKLIKDKIILANALSDEIAEAYKSNDEKGKSVVAGIISGSKLKKYRLIKKLSAETGIYRQKFRNTTSKKINLLRTRTRNRRMMENVQRNIKTFLSRDDNSRVMPGKNDKVKVNGAYTQKSVLNDSMAYLHLKYNTETTRKISFSTFCRMRSKNIALTKFLSRNKCLCQKHQNMALTVKAMKNIGDNVSLNPDEYGRQIQVDGATMQTYLEQITDDEIPLQQWRRSSRWEEENKSS